MDAQSATAGRAGCSQISSGGEGIGREPVLLVSLCLSTGECKGTDAMKLSNQIYIYESTRKKEREKEREEGLT